MSSGLSVYAGLFCFVVVAKSTWTTGSLTSVCDPFECVYAYKTSVYSVIQRHMSMGGVDSSVVRAPDS